MHTVIVTGGASGIGLATGELSLLEGTGSSWLTGMPSEREPRRRDSPTAVLPSNRGMSTSPSPRLSSHSSRHC